MISITGEVKYPGGYTIIEGTTRLLEIIEKAGIITSSPSCKLYCSFNASSANKLADEPELTAIPKEQPI